MLTLYNLSALLRDFGRGGLRDRYWNDRFLPGCNTIWADYGWLIIVGLAVLAVLAVVITLLIRRQTRKKRGVQAEQAQKWQYVGPDGGKAGGPAEALRILDERYARGEIDEEEYLRRKDLIRGR